jgi:hypothetical protein
LDPPNFLFGGHTDGALNAVEKLMRKRYVYSFPRVLADFDCALTALALALLHRELLAEEKVYTKHPVFRSCTHATFTSRKPHGELLRRVRWLYELFSPQFDLSQEQDGTLLQAVQDYLNGLTDPLQLLVFDEEMGKEAAFEGEPLRPKASRVYFYRLRRHLFFLSEPEKFFDRAICSSCTALTPRCTGRHYCVVARFCLKCNTNQCWLTKKEQANGGEAFSHLCDACNTLFVRHRCFLLHSSGRYPFRCHTHKTCPRCLRIVEREKLRSHTLLPHKCLVYTCRYCKDEFPAPGNGGEKHFCLVQKPKARDLGTLEAAFSRCYFDLETVQRGEERNLVPYLCTAVFCCSYCLDDFEKPSDWKKAYPCCGQRIRVYWFQEGFFRFVREVFGGGRKDVKRGVAFAFNLRSFDGIFLLRILTLNNVPMKHLTLQGDRILTLEVNGIQVLKITYYVNFSPKDFFPQRCIFFKGRRRSQTQILQP